MNSRHCSNHLTPAICAHSLRAATWIVVTALAMGSVSAEEAGKRWLKGSTHVHGVLEGHGFETAPEWYRTNGYQFIVRTEHERVLAEDATHAWQQGFIVIPGQEITQTVLDASHPDGVRQVHVNGLGLREVILPDQQGQFEQRGRDSFANDEAFIAWYRQQSMKVASRLSVGQALVRNISAIRKQGGVPQVNQPNFYWSLRPSDFIDVEGPFLLEIANGYPFANNGGGTSLEGEEGLSTEALWDHLLGIGKRVWGVASDDAHDYKNFAYRNALTPGKAWIVVRSHGTDAESIKQSLLAGEFYASTGVELEDVRKTTVRLEIDIRQPIVRFELNAPPAMPPSARFTTRFIGRGGAVLKTVHGEHAIYDIAGDERYVRAVIVDSDGRKARTQPIFLEQKSKSQAAQLAVDANGKVHERGPVDLPYSALASEEAKKHFIEFVDGFARLRSANSVHADRGDVKSGRQMLDDLLMRPGVERLRTAFPVSITPEMIGGVQTDVIVPQVGIAPGNKRRVLISLHGGGFMAGARYGGQQESIPIASLANIKVITVDYRMAPEHRFPAASEDVAAVYREVLKQYRPESIGIYGCSAGGVLTAQAAAWFQTHNLPRPGAIGIFGGGALIGKGGDSNMLSSLLTGGAISGARDEDTQALLVYFRETNLDDPMVSPARSAAVLSKFPPTLLISGTRDLRLSNTVYTHAQLVKAGVEADLHVWEGAVHCSFAQPVVDPLVPETREAWDVIVRFFDKHLARE